MNSLLTLTLLCLITVGQVLSQFHASAGASSLVGSITGGVSNTSPDPTRWIEFMDMENDWSQLGTSFSVEAWIMHSSLGQSNWQPVLARHPGMNAPSEEAHFIIAIVNNSLIEVTAGCGCDSNGKNCGDGFFLLSPISVSTWHHVAVTFDGENTTSATATLYLDGVQVDTTNWSAEDPQCLGRPSQWATYAPVKVGFLDDETTSTTNTANPNFYMGWWGQIDEIRFWFGILSSLDVAQYRDIGLKGTETDLFAYYQFSPSQEVLSDNSAAKQITNKVGDWLHGLPSPNPTDAGIFAQSSLVISSYSVVEGQSDKVDVPLPNSVYFESWPETNTTVYTFSTSGYSVALNNLLNNPNVYAAVYPSTDGLSATVFVDCTNNDCSNYEAQWRDYYMDYQAIIGGVTTTSARMYLQIVTGCPSGVFDECGTCDGDNSQCQCVVYHGFGTERMNFILFEWSISNILSEVYDALNIISSTQTTLETVTPSNGVLRQQIYDFMSFYNDQLTTYCGDLQDFTNQLDAVVPSNTFTITDESSNPAVDGSIPFVPSFNPNF